jgi:hypothetical protein
MEINGNALTAGTAVSVAKLLLHGRHHVDLAWILDRKVDGNPNVRASHRILLAGVPDKTHAIP